MIALDLFADLDATAREYGWTALGQPERLVRRYGKRVGDREVTVRAYANRSGTALMRVSRQQVGERTRALSDDLRGSVKGKRDAALKWLRGIA